ncbi:hypothetical protein G8O24_33665 [Bradyrhizobium sp. INPA01-394B]|uniref:Transposase n=1 Tax=Bradyrhizobium campsiandrae TaxID=1729892 RepID=A0ABR7UGE9_9BRAD|nr:hypothetical protein [Bradyrhizobium campsiandrae]MBC9983165.1 hypothetical protein [Bradyrhizobium campsiandrae]
MKRSPWQKPPTASGVGTTCQKVRITHPFHPLCGHEFTLICRRRHWGEDRVVHQGRDGRVHTIPSAWTDIDPVDEFRRVGGRAAFRTVDLLALSEALGRFGEGTGGG